ncbi:MAG: hypothetical protein E7773_15150 [Sphingomonas sp.]|uniref:hypothetical protein n=1 Tax=Sphingomonas sp. TaxID=28214 RepID=UPI0011F46362|nr:hypothetical protein [Sphingomonas sp.]THD34519.1 MAG: hypothetical protein E7773_15150 [Sphingomonas sp.]
MPFFRFSIAGQAAQRFDNMRYNTTRTFFARDVAVARRKALNSALLEFGRSAEVEDVFRVSFFQSFQPPNRGAAFYE